MKHYAMSKTIFPALFLVTLYFFSISTFAAAYNYADLRMKNFEEMQNRVRARLKKAESISNQDPQAALSFLKDALQLTFSRPDSDNMIAKLVAPVRTLLRNLEAYEKVLTEIATSATEEAKDKKLKPRDRATNLIILLNLMGELKPEAPNNPLINKIFAKIEKADINIEDDVKSEMRLRAMMPAPRSPSKIAGEILKEAAKKAKLIEKPEPSEDEPD